MSYPASTEEVFDRMREAILAGMPIGRAVDDILHDVLEALAEIDGDSRIGGEIACLQMRLEK